MRSKIKKLPKILLKEFALLSTEILIVLIIGAASIVIFAQMALWLANNQVERFDNTVAQFVLSFTSPSMTAIMKTVTILGNPQFAFIPGTLLFLYFLFIKPHRWYSIMVPVIGVGSFFLNRFMKFLFNRPRPILEDRLVEVLYNLSFPSGHAMFGVAFYGFIIYIIWKFVPNKAIKVSSIIFTLIVIFLIGISRVYLKVHYPSDIVAGFAAGFIWLITAVLTVKGIERFIKRKEKKDIRVEGVEIKKGE